MIGPRDLPAVNAALNATSAVLLACGYLAIRSRRITVHKALMLTALGVSTLFLASYLYYHFSVGMTRFSAEAPGLVRGVYFTILASHVILAIVTVPLALVTVYLGLSDRLVRHLGIARWTLPIWLYVSVTGVIVYWMLYHLYPR
jgi:putative membrane protein